MKILQIYELRPYECGAGGVEVVIAETSKRLVEMGHEVTILSGANSNVDEEYIDGIRVKTVDFLGFMGRSWNPSNLTFGRQLMFPLSAILNRLGSFDIYHGHIYSSGLVANLLARVNGGVAVNTIHGSYYPVWDVLTDPISAAFYKNVERILAPALARISGVQIHTGEYFAKQVLKWGVHEDKIRVIHNGVDVERFNPDVEPILKSDVPIVLTARRLVKKNGIDYLVRAMKDVLRTNQCRLMILGRGPECANLKRLVFSLGIEEHVDFMGAIPYDGMPGYIAAADVVVVPSIIEASSLFMLEAMAMGKAVVATDAGGLPEVMDEDSGILVPAMNEKALTWAIVKLLDDSVLQRKLGKCAQRLVISRFTWDKVTKQIEEEYLRLLELD
ncbi:MAG: glycosyltransferase family 4 protein [Bacteroidales bacterium]|nr:glycosyltransferase family 4 protein [Bacteroidales bacterium]